MFNWFRKKDSRKSREKIIRSYYRYRSEYADYDGNSLDLQILITRDEDHKYDYEIEGYTHRGIWIDGWPDEDLCDQVSWIDREVNEVVEDFALDFEDVVDGRVPPLTRG